MKISNKAFRTTDRFGLVQCVMRASSPLCQDRIAVKQRERRRLKAQAQREQSNRKIEINRQLRELKADLSSLSQ